jgi:hypothetical protein
VNTPALSEVDSIDLYKKKHQPMLNNLQHTHTVTSLESSRNKNLIFDLLENKKNNVLYDYRHYMHEHPNIKMVTETFIESGTATK